MLVLGSNSPRRRELLEAAGIKIDKIVTPNIDESLLKAEKPRVYVERMALSKSKVISKSEKDFVITADTIVTKGSRVLGKPENEEVARKFLKLLSGCRHRVITAVCLSFENKLHLRIVETVVKLKNLSDSELDRYLKCEEWRDKAGGYAIQGRASTFIPFISGSYSNVVGLPLMETTNLLIGAGYKFDDIEAKT